MTTQSKTAQGASHARDAVITLKEDGTLEVSLPDVGVTEIPSHVVTAACLVWTLQDPETCNMLHDRFFAFQSKYSFKSVY